MAGDRAQVMSLDARGLRCPMPVIRLESVLRGLAVGAQVRVVADDPIAALDIPNACREGGHAYEKLADEAGACVFLVTRGRKPPRIDGDPGL